MRVCCQDMFFSRSRSTQASHQLLNIPSTQQQNRTLGTPLESMFKNAKKPSHKLNAVKELLDVKIKDPVEQDFSNEVYKQLFFYFQPFLVYCDCFRYMSFLENVS